MSLRSLGPPLVFLAVGGARAQASPGLGVRELQFGICGLSHLWLGFLCFFCSFSLNMVR